VAMRSTNERCVLGWRRGITAESLPAPSRPEHMPSTRSPSPRQSASASGARMPRFGSCGSVTARCTGSELFDIYGVAFIREGRARAMESADTEALIGVSLLYEHGLRIHIVEKAVWRPSLDRRLEWPDGGIPPAREAGRSRVDPQTHLTRPRPGMGRRSYNLAGARSYRGCDRYDADVRSHFREWNVSLVGATDGSTY
jgi:hypothetical protein